MKAKKKIFRFHLWLSLLILFLQGAAPVVVYAEPTEDTTSEENVSEDSEAAAEAEATKSPTLEMPTIPEATEETPEIAAEDKTTEVALWVKHQDTTNPLPSVKDEKVIKNNGTVTINGTLFAGETTDGTNSQTKVEAFQIQLKDEENHWVDIYQWTPEENDSFISETPHDFQVELLEDRSQVELRYLVKGQELKIIDGEKVVNNLNGQITTPYSVTTTQETTQVEVSDLPKEENLLPLIEEEVPSVDNNLIENPLMQLFGLPMLRSATVPNGDSGWKTLYDMDCGNNLYVNPNATKIKIEVYADSASVARVVIYIEADPNPSAIATVMGIDVKGFELKDASNNSITTLTRAGTVVKGVKIPGTNIKKFEFTGFSSAGEYLKNPNLYKVHFGRGSVTSGIVLYQGLNDYSTKLADMGTHPNVRTIPMTPYTIPPVVTPPQIAAPEKVFYTYNPHGEVKYWIGDLGNTDGRQHTPENVYLEVKDLQTGAVTISYPRGHSVSSDGYFHGFILYPTDEATLNKYISEGGRYEVRAVVKVREYATPFYGPSMTFMMPQRPQVKMVSSSTGLYSAAATYQLNSHVGPNDFSNEKVEFRLYNQDNQLIRSWEEYGVGDGNHAVNASQLQNLNPNITYRLTIEALSKAKQTEVPNLDGKPVVTGLPAAYSYQLSINLKMLPLPEIKTLKVTSVGYYGVDLSMLVDNKTCANDITRFEVREKGTSNWALLNYTSSGVKVVAGSTKDRIILKPGTTYEVQGYIKTNGEGRKQEYRTSAIEFTTEKLPEVAKPTVSNVTDTTADLKAVITQVPVATTNSLKDYVEVIYYYKAEGAVNWTPVKLRESSNGTGKGTAPSKNTGDALLTLEGLIPGTKYYVKGAVATEDGYQKSSEIFGSEVCFYTKSDELKFVQWPAKFDFGTHHVRSTSVQEIPLIDDAYSGTEQTDGFHFKVFEDRVHLNGWKISMRCETLKGETPYTSERLQGAKIVFNVHTPTQTKTIHEDDEKEITLSGGAPVFGDLVTGNQVTIPVWTSTDTASTGVLLVANPSDGDGVWDVKVDFDSVKLVLPAEQGKADTNYSSQITWTLDDIL